MEEASAAPEPNDGGSGPLAAAIARIEAPANWLVRVATAAAGFAALPGVVLWWALAGARLGEWWRGTLTAALLLVVLLAPALWLLNVRLAVTSLLGLPATLGDVARRRGGEVRARRIERPRGGLIGGMRMVRGVVRDYRSVAATKAVVVQLITPSFWLLTAGAFAAVPLLWLAVLVAGAAQVLS